MVGYSGFYDLSLIVGSYAFLFASMAAHAMQSAFPATLLKSSYDHAPVLAFVLLTVSLSTCTDIERLYGEYKLLAGRKSIPPPFNTSNKPPLSNTPLPPNIALVSPRKRPSTPMDPGLIALVALVTALVERTLLGGRPELPSTICLIGILGRMSSCGVTWIGSGASALPGNAIPRRYIYICVVQNVRFSTHLVIHTYHHMRTPNTYHRPPKALGTCPPPHALSPLAALPRVWARAIVPGTLSEQVSRAPFCEELLLPTRGNEGWDGRSV